MEFEKVDGVATDCDYGIIPIAAGATVLLGAGYPTPTALFGRIVSSKKLMLVTDQPCLLNIAFEGQVTGPNQNWVLVPLEDVLVINSPIVGIQVTAGITGCNLQVAVAGQV